MECRFVRPAAFAEMLGISASMARKMCRDGSVRAFKPKGTSTWFVDVPETMKMWKEEELKCSR